MAFNVHDNDIALDRKLYDYGDDEKPSAHTNEYAPKSAFNGRAGPDIGRLREAPPLVKNLAPEDRQRLERALVRKIDLRLLPMVILMYIMNYLDRNNIAAARLAGLEEDLHLSSTEFNVFHVQSGQGGFFI